MEASQSYYLYKDSLRRKQMSSSVETRKSKIRGIAISWLIEALKTVL